jgi:hypothetical protein
MSDSIETQKNSYNGPVVTTREQYDQLPDDVKMTYHERVRAVKLIGKKFPDFAEPRIRKQISEEEGK